MAQFSPSNPIPEILELVPYFDRILDHELYDSIRTVILKATRTPVPDGYIVMLLAELEKAGLLQAATITPTATSGVIIYIKRIPNGEQVEE